MLTEQVASRRAVSFRKEYLKNVELARVLEKQAEKKREKGSEELQLKLLKERTIKLKRPEQ
ncbi:hypothetical protein H2248_011436 [Termitomyces sp. 'cryptogamus']|nr:hypothetical protein H2248_011436 [Termitomyces sp. 'cryptogamus']